MKTLIGNFIVPSDFRDKKICVIGLGFVGLTLATVMAQRGFDVTGVEIREDLVSLISSGNAHFFEPDLASSLNDVVINKKLVVCNEIPDNCQSTVFVITVGTPVDDEKNVNLNSIIAVTQEISKHLKNGDLVILRSTVKLGVTRNVVCPILHKTGKLFEIAFCPERTVEGQAMVELNYLPQIIGSDTISTSVRAGNIFQFITPTVVRVSNFETAEMIKLVDNTRRDVMFGFSNEIAKICDSIGVNASEVISSGRFGYSRTDIPVPGLVGGPCLSKDSYILSESLQSYNIKPEIILAARKVNENQPRESVFFLSKFIKKNNFPDKKLTISLLGIAFKGTPPTDDLRGTTAKIVLDELKLLFPLATFRGYDPVVSNEDVKNFGLIPFENVYDATEGCDVIIILNNHNFFSLLDIKRVAHKMANPGIIYDFWNNFSEKRLSLPKNIYYLSLGSHCIVNDFKD